MVTNRQVALMDRLHGFLFCFFWFFSIYFGFLFLLCPLLIFVFLKPKLFRRWTDLVFAMWELYPVAMMEIWCGVKFKITGDKINPFEGSVIIMNHRTRLDWNFLWAAVHHSCTPLSHNMKFILKAPVMHIPGPGWVMQICSFLFIHRSWEKDKALIGNVLDYLRDSEQTCQILIFPEGTDLTEKSLEKSHKYADKQGLDRYFRVLHPKTTGFAYLAKHMMQNGQLQAVYDLTIGYPKTTPQTELDLARGSFPEELHFLIKRFDVCDLPHEEESLKGWLNTIWKEKENNLRKFDMSKTFSPQDCTPDCFEQNCTNEKLHKDYYDRIRNFTNSNLHIEENCNQTMITKPPINHFDEYNSKYGRPNNSLYMGLLFWTSFVILSFYILYSNFYLQIWALFHSLLFLIFSFISPGFHMMVAKFHSDRNCNKIK